MLGEVLDVGGDDGHVGLMSLVVALRVWTHPAAITARMTLSWVSPVMACGF